MLKAKYKIDNIVLAASYEGAELNLERVASSLEGARYDPEVSPWVTYRMSEPKASFLIFASGKVSCAGVNSLKGAKKAIDNLTEHLQESGFDVGEPEVEVQTMVATVDFDRRFDVGKIVKDFRHAERNPNIPSTGLVFRMGEVRAGFLLFAHGEGVCVGAKSREEIEEANDRGVETIE